MTETPAALSACRTCSISAVCTASKYTPVSYPSVIEAPPSNPLCLPQTLPAFQIDINLGTSPRHHLSPSLYRATPRPHFRTVIREEGLIATSA